jgi:uracil-DNA glycosylase
MIDHFVAALAEAQTPPSLFNPYGWRPDVLSGGARRQNLADYLRLMARREPTLLLVGEAPGYRGCRLTGIPFTSPQILASGQLALPYRPTPDGFEGQKEATATAVWRTIAPLPNPPLLWNALPFHPHEGERPFSNRTPKREEVELGRPFLDHLLALFPIQTIIAVGKQADQALERWGYAHVTVRHPAHGGQRAFQAGLAQFFSGR